MPIFRTSAMDCPAHAGIDLGRRDSLPLVPGLPRARGDRPWRREPGNRGTETAPRTRGSTPRVLAIPSARCDCPAHAGIDPHLFQIFPTTSRLPRARGDRPSQCIGKFPTATTAPRTRGSTREVDTFKRCVDDCPAHAGIDPGGQQVSPPLFGLPRARGDRPRKAVRSRRSSMTAPRTRGSTVHPPPPPLRQRDCPAHAGIDLDHSAHKSKPLGLPRARGDRPS